MIRRALTRGFRLGLFGGLAWLGVRIVTTLRREEAPPLIAADPAPWPPLPAVETVPEPAAEVPPAPVVEDMIAAPEPATGGPGWVVANGETAAPDGFPIKAKLSSGIFHLPGMQNYDRTAPDRWYADEAAAEADGLRKAKR